MYVGGKGKLINQFMFRNEVRWEGSERDTGGGGVVAVIKRQVIYLVVWFYLDEVDLSITPA